jgi:S1-C subfamily serine protease
MTTCRACSSEITGPDRYCRNCRAPAAPTVAEFDDTRRFSPSNPLPAVPPGVPDNTNPLNAAQSAAYAAPQGSAQSAPLALLVKLIFRKNLAWALIALMLITFVGLGIGIGRGIRGRRPADWGGRAARAARNDVDAARARHEYEEAVQNALGFKQGVFSTQDFSDVRGIFVNSLMSDDSPAALAGIHAGDLMTELGEKLVRNNGELSQVLETLKTGDEVPVKVYRDGAVVSLRIKIADRAFPPLQPKIEPRDQGFLGILNSNRRCCIPGTKKWGVEVDELHVNGPAELYGLRPGDFITEFNGHPVKTPNEFNRRIRAVKPRSKVPVTLYRGGAEQKIEVTVGRRW